MLMNFFLIIPKYTNLYHGSQTILQLFLKKFCSRRRTRTPANLMTPSFQD